MTHRLAALAAVVSLSLAWAAPAQAQDARYLAANCANCHGTEGRAAAGGGMPGLAGLSRNYFIEQMNAFRSGTRQATIMHQLAKGYSDEQISRLADYFAQIKPVR
ncbi:MAG: c-type cytochrome [Burkholderiales bacterium]|jgi:cytochrome c553